MSATPAVSVILPTRNRAHLLRPAVLSVLAQGWRDLELIVVDDASTDDTAAVVAGFGDERLRYLRLERNVGPAAARNRAIEQARGEWLAFQDSDDEWLSGKLAAQMALALRLPDDYVGIGSTLLRKTPRELERVRWPVTGTGEAPQEVPRAAIVAGGTAYLQSLLLRRRAVCEVGGFDETLGARSDIELCLRLLRAGRFAAVDLPLALSIETPGGVSLHKPQKIASSRAIIARHRDLIETTPGAAARWHYDLARLELVLGQRQAALSSLLRSLGGDTMRLRPWLLLALALLPTAVAVKVLDLQPLARRARGRVST